MRPWFSQSPWPGAPPMGRGSFHCLPATKRHAPPVDGALVFITVDSAWEMSRVDGVPAPEGLPGPSWKTAGKR